MFKIQQLVSVFLQLVTGIMNILVSAGSMTELEEKIQRLVQKTAGQLLEWSLSEIDARLAKDQEPGKYENKGIRSRILVTTVGEIELKRRYYRETETGKNCFLLDETLGITPRKRVSSRLEKMMLDMGTETSFRRASTMLEYLAPGISPMMVWSEVQQAGARAKKEAEEVRAEVFEDGVIPDGKRSVQRLNIEADGVMIKQQRSSKRHEEIKLVVAYENKEDGKPLVNRRTVAGVGNSSSIWEQASAKFSHEWHLNGKEEIRIGGDGAAWIKEGTEIFPGSTYQLDLFHLRKRLTEALGFNADYYQAVAEKIRELDHEGLEEVFKHIVRNTREKNKQKRILDLQNYIFGNWGGISNLPKEERLGVIEGQVRHTIARRMKNIGGGWSSTGTDHMARLLAAKANNELSKYSGDSQGFKRDRIANVLPKTIVNPKSKPSKKDVSEWLAASMPLLEGPASDKMWVKYVIRPLTSASYRTA